MKNPNSTHSQDSSGSTTPQMGFSPWQWLKTKRIAYLTVPLLVAATLTEFVILATGYKYQKLVCLPMGMGVTFFGIGPIGATILAVELLKLPLAIWTASRHGLQKAVMLVFGLPLICLLTFQLVKDMAVYEMGIALTPASHLLGEAMQEEVKTAQLNGELAAIEAKKADREHKLAELGAKKATAEAGLAASLKRNEESRLDAISLTDYQKKELSDVDIRQATMIKQFDADTAEITKAIADRRALRETELGRATEWNAEEARIDNDYKANLADYTNKKVAYEKAQAHYNNANILKRQFMKEPITPGVPPERESNTILKPTSVAEIDAQIKTKEAELLAVNSQRRERVAQVEADAHQLRGEFDHRSGAKREATDLKREQLLGAQAALSAPWAAEEKQINEEFDTTARKADGIRAELDASRRKAEGFYEAREASIKNTQVHRIATTVEIVRGLLMGQRPVSIKATARERGDLYTDQISMVRIWVYPVLAFIVAFLPTLLVEICFSTIFQPERRRPAYRVGFFGRRLHWLYTRAGRQKILRAERLASEASGGIVVRDKALAAANASAEQALADQAARAQAAAADLAAAAARHEEQLKKQETEWVAKLASMADSLNRTVVEKDGLRDLQKSEIERQIQMRQNAWSDRLTQLRQELDGQRAAAETERTALIQEQHQKLMEVSEDSKTQVIQVRRQMADAELAGVEKSSRLAHDLKAALHARDQAESQLKQQADSLSLKLSQTEEDAAREIAKAARQEKHRLEQQQVEFEAARQQREEDFGRRLKQREQQLQTQAELRFSDGQAQAEQELRRRESEFGRQLDTQSREADTRFRQELQQKEESFQAKSRQRDEQWQAKLDAVRIESQAQTEKEHRRREVESAEAGQRALRELEAKLRQEMQQKEEAVQAKARQREQDLAAQAEAHHAARSQWETESEEKKRATTEHFKTQLERTEKERDEAREFASERSHHVQALEKKLTEASTFLNGWKNGKNLVTPDR